MNTNKERWEKLLRKAQPEMDRLKRWGRFYELNPSFCPHPSLIAPVAEDGSEQPGICLYCNSENVMSDGEIPDGEPFTAQTTSTAYTTTTQANWC